MSERRLSRFDGLALALLTIAVGVIYARVLFTPLIPASGDFLAYFAPYWHLLNQALRAGRLPLWNDYIYAGAPFQANPQTEVFYPLRWPMIWLSAEKGILWTAALHVWLAGIFGYLLFRTRRVRTSTDAAPSFAQVIPALIVALLIALNGWVMGLLLHPNQLSTYPWLIAAILLWEKRPHPSQWPRWDRATRRWGVGMTGVWSMAFLAGHTQSFYNAAVIFALWIIGDGVIRARLGSSASGRRWSWLADYWPVALAALMAAGAVAAVQLLPTLELSQLSYRQGGLAFRDHAALSLPPWRLGFTLLPHYARNLGMALGTEAYGEWVGAIGVTGVAMALLGLRHPDRRWRFLGLFLTLSGLLLALGAYDPLEYLLYRIVPGWDLFRVPARFLQAAMLGLALLAGLGVQVLGQTSVNHLRRSWRRPSGLLMGGIVLLLLLLGLITRPNALTVLGWGVILLGLLGLLLLAPAQRRRWLWLLSVLLFFELYGASYSLPIQHPTTPQALRSWRTAPARIASELGPAPHARACRTLSLSSTTWDPGDLALLRNIYGPYLDDWAFRDLINATKAKEVVAPNLGALFDIPSLDGFGGGVLPTARFVKGMGLFLPPDRIVADGRLREQLDHIPRGDLLSLFNVCYVIADKNFDVWHDDIYYDLAFGERLDAEYPSLTLLAMPIFPASGVGIVSHLGPEAASLAPGTPVARVDITFYDDSTLSLPLRAGQETAVGADASRPSAQNDLPAVRWPHDAPGQDVIAELDFPASSLPARLADRRLRSVRIQRLRPDVDLFIRGMAVYDRESGAHSTPIVTRFPWQRIHSGDVKIYRNNAVLPRAFAVPGLYPVADVDEAVAFMQDERFDPARTAVVETASLPAARREAAFATPELQILSQSPEAMRLHYRAAGEALALITDAWHPGWRAILDPDSADARPLTLFPADIFLRGVLLPAGEHDLALRFQPRSLHRGAIITLLALAGLALLWLLPDSHQD